MTPANAPATSTPSPGHAKSAAPPVTLAYRYAAGQVLQQTTRQTQTFTSEARPDQSSEQISMLRVESRVVSVDADGTALIDEVTTLQEDPNRRDHKQMKTTRLGEILWVDIIRGEPTSLRGGALFVDRPVRPGDTWTTRLKRIGGGAAHEIALQVKLASVMGSGSKREASLLTSGRMDEAAVNAMLGGAAQEQGLKGKECLVTGDVTFNIEAGREISSRLELSCRLEQTSAQGPPAPATLKISYETGSEDPLIPSIPAP